MSREEKERIRRLMFEALKNRVEFGNPESCPAWIVTLDDCVHIEYDEDGRRWILEMYEGTIGEPFEATTPVTIEISKETFNQLCHLRYLTSITDNDNVNTKDVPQLILMIVECDLKDWIDEFEIVRHL